MEAISDCCRHGDVAKKENVRWCEACFGNRAPAATGVVTSPGESVSDVDATDVIGETALVPIPEGYAPAVEDAK